MKRSILISLLCLLLASLTSCVGVRRSPTKGYGYYSGYTNYGGTYYPGYGTPPPPPPPSYGGRPQNRPVQNVTPDRRPETNAPGPSKPGNNNNNNNRPGNNTKPSNPPSGQRPGVNRH